MPRLAPRSRRFGAAASAATSSVALAVALGACPGRGAPPGPPTGTPAATATREPVRGGEVVVAYPHEPATLNPFVRGGDAPPTRDLVRPLYPGLFRLGPDGSREPWLLASEPGAADVGGAPFSVRVRLREEAVWSDGRPITVEDLRFTWRTALGGSTIATEDGYDRLADIVAEGPKVGRLVFTEPFARWRDLFSAGLGVLPAHALAGKDFSGALAGAWPVSGGPFVLRSWTRGLEIVLERNPRAWGGEPLLDRIRVLFVPDPVTALQLYARGAVDVLGPYPAVDFARRAAGLPGAQVTGDRGATWTGLFLNTRTPALADVRVRRALALAVDRAGIVEGLVRGQGAPLDAPTAGDPARRAPAFARYEHDPGEARALLESAGFRRDSGGVRRKGSLELSVTLAASGADELPDRVLRAMNAQAEAVGIDLNLVALDADRLWGFWLSSSRFQAALLITRDPPGGSLRARFGLAGPHNVSRLADERLGRALDLADRALDDDAPAVDAPHDRVAELVPVIPLFVLEVTIAARSGIHEVAASAAADGFLWNAGRWWREPGAPSPAATRS